MSIDMTGEWKSEAVQAEFQGKKIASIDAFSGSLNIQEVKKGEFKVLRICLEDGTMLVLQPAFGSLGYALTSAR